jgi:calcineurin-like phosphoesterase family protein
MHHLFSADYHLGHKNILKYCGRTIFMTKEDKEIYNNLAYDKQDKFILSDESLDNMNKGIVSGHNERVKKEDILYHIGDLCFKGANDRGNGQNVKPEYWLNQLNGNIILLQGNHDIRNGVKTKIQSIIIKIGKEHIELIHDPEHVSGRTNIALVGHVHNSWQIRRVRKGNSFTDCVNVGVDVWDFKPVTWEEILKRLHQWRRKEKLL